MFYVNMLSVLQCVAVCCSVFSNGYLEFVGSQRIVATPRWSGGGDERRDKARDKTVSAEHEGDGLMGQRIRRNGWGRGFRGEKRVHGAERGRQGREKERKKNQMY